MNREELMKEMFKLKRRTFWLKLKTFILLIVALATIIFAYRLMIIVSRVEWTTLFVFLLQSLAMWCLLVELEKERSALSTELESLLTRAASDGVIIRKEI